jgi:hypothetical protein
VPTLAKVISDVRHRLAGAGAYTDMVSELREAIDASALTIPVDAAFNGAAGGVYEIGLEKVRVKAVNETDSSLEVYSFGRGYDGTVAASHAAGAEVVHAPVFPASTVASEVNGVLFELYPSLYAVRQHEAQYATAGFTVPADATGIIAVYRQGAGGVGWHRLDQWRFDPDAGNGLWVKHVDAGETVRVVYAARPGVFDLSSAAVLADDFADVTGLDARVADVIALGVAYRLAPFFDTSRLPATGAESRADGQSKPPGAGAQAGRLLLAEFTSRVQQEAAVLAKEHPIRVHRER